MVEEPTNSRPSSPAVSHELIQEPRSTAVINEYDHCYISSDAEQHPEIVEEPVRPPSSKGIIFELIQ